MNRTRVLLAEDHAIMADHLRRVLERDFDVIAVMADGFALVAAAQELRPDVVVADISMPGMDGIAATREITRSHPEIRIAIVTVHNDRVLLEKAFEAGAKAYVLKAAADEELPDAIKAVLNDGSFVSKQLRDRQDNEIR